MREIEYRGKRKDTEEWIYGSLVIDDDKYYICLGISEYIKKDDYEVYMIEVDPETVGQYTGLKDKNEVKIYENDILAYKDWEGETIIDGVVKYGVFNCSCCNGVYGWYIDEGDIRMCEDNELEVIGNIYDNPELLDKENTDVK